MMLIRQRKTKTVVIVYFFVVAFVTLLTTEPKLHLNN